MAYLKDLAKCLTQVSHWIKILRFLILKCTILLLFPNHTSIRIFKQKIIISAFSQQILSSMTYVGSSFLFLSRHGTVCTRCESMSSSVLNRS